MALNPGHTNPGHLGRCGRRLVEGHRPVLGLCMAPPTLDIWNVVGAAWWKVIGLY